MKIFVAGATGYIGSAVVKSLLAHGHSVVGSARSKAAADKLRAVGVEPVTADLSDAQSFVAPSRACDAVIQTASTADANSPVYEPKAAEAILSALLGSDKPFILTSGVWVYGKAGETAATEDTPVNPFALVAWRPATEERVRNAKGIRGVVIRPGMVYGNGGGIPAMFTASAKANKSVQIPGDGNSRWAVVHVNDLANLYALAIEKAPAGGLFNGTTDERISLGDICRAIAKNNGATATSIPLEEARKHMGMFADALALDQIVDSPRSREVLAWKPGAQSLRDDIARGGY